MIVIPGNHDSRNVGYVHFEELFGERRSELHRGRRLDRGGRLHRARPRPRGDRPRPLRVDRGALRRQRGLPAHLRAAPPPAAGARHGPRAQRRARRRRHARVPPARRRAPGALRATSTCPTRGGSRTCSWSTPGTVSTTRLRGKTKPCYNVIEATPGAGHGATASTPSTSRTRSSRFDPRTYEYEKDQSLLGRDGARLSRATAAVARPVIALIDGEHHPAAVRDALDRPRRESRAGRRGLLRRRGEARRRARSTSTTAGRSRPTRSTALRRLAPGGRRRVVDLADEPVLPPSAQAARWPRSRCTSGLRYEAPGLRLDPPALRAGRLRRAEAGRDRHRQAHRQDRGGRALGRRCCASAGRPGDRLHGPRRARPSRAWPRPDTGARRPARDRRARRHAASDYLEDAVLAGVRTVGCRRVGGGLAGAPAESNVPAGRRARGRRCAPGRDHLRGLGLLHPAGGGRPHASASSARASPSRSPSTALLRADLAAGPRGRAGAAGRACASSCAPSRPSRCRTARAWRCSPPAPPRCEGVEPVVASTNLARRGALAADLERAAAGGLRRLPHRAQGGRDRHGRPARAEPRARAWCSCATGRSASTRLDELLLEAAPARMA